MWRINWKDQIGHQKLKELLPSETWLANSGSDARSLSERKSSAAIQIQCRRMAHNHRVVATTPPPRDRKVMTWNRRKPPNQRCCSLFRIEDYEKLSASTPRRCRNYCLLLWSMRLSRERVCPKLAGAPDSGTPQDHGSLERSTCNSQRHSPDRRPWLRSSLLALGFCPDPALQTCS